MMQIKWLRNVGKYKPLDLDSKNISFKEQSRSHQMLSAVAKTHSHNNENGT